MHPVMLHLLCNAVHVTSETCPGLLRAEKVRTTGLAGGLLSPYKGLLPASARKGALKGLPTAPHTQLPLKGAFSVLPYSGSAP